MFSSMLDVQQLWYQAQLSLDEKEKYELLRDIAEHNAMFMNPEGVQSVRDARENSFSLTDEEFDQVLQENFGRRLDTPPEPKADPMNLDLDDITFTPIK